MNWPAFGYMSSAALAGIVAHPFDTIKVRLMTQDYSDASKLKYSGIFNCAAVMVKEEGIWSLWKGCTATILRNSATMWFLFVYFRTRKEINFLNNNNQLLKNLIFMPFGFPALAAALLSNPFDFVKIRMQGDRSKMFPQTWTVDTLFQAISSGEENIRYQSIREVFERISIHEGSKSLWIGYGLNWSRIIIQTPIEALMFITLPLTEGKSRSQVFKAFGILCLLLSVLITPIDFVKAKLMSAPQGEYSESWDAISKTLKNEEFTTLFTGLSVEVIRIALFYPTAVFFYWRFIQLAQKF